MEDQDYDLDRGFSQKSQNLSISCNLETKQNNNNFFPNIFEILVSGDDELAYEDYAEEDEENQDNDCVDLDSNVDEDDEHKYYCEAVETAGLEQQLAGLEASIDNLVNAGNENDDNENIELQKFNCRMYEEAEEDELDGEVLENEDEIDSFECESLNIEVLNDDTVRRL